jgi:hypothetical protein
MDREYIIKMAREVGIPTGRIGGYDKELKRFADLVAAAVAEPEQEPVAWANSNDLQNFDMKVRTGPDLHHTVPLYTTPPKREWVGLTDEEIDILSCEMVKGDKSVNWLCKVLEAKLKEKNHG